MGSNTNTLSYSNLKKVVSRKALQGIDTTWEVTFLCLRGSKKTSVRWADRELSLNKIKWWMEEPVSFFVSTSRWCGRLCTLRGVKTPVLFMKGYAKNILSQYCTTLRTEALAKQLLGEDMVFDFDMLIRWSQDSITKEFFDKSLNDGWG